MKTLPFYIREISCGVLILGGVLLSGPMFGAAKPVFDFAEVGPEAYRPLRRELRAFHPDECHGKCKRHPERHQDLMIKVCGFSARFVSLSKRWQDEVIARHRLK